MSRIRKVTVMRKILISLLLAGAAATPAIAAPTIGPTASRPAKTASPRKRIANQRERNASRPARTAARDRATPSVPKSRRPTVPRVRIAPMAAQTSPRRHMRKSWGVSRPSGVPTLATSRRFVRRVSRPGTIAATIMSRPALASSAPRDASSLREQTAQRRDQRVQERELRQSSRPTARVFADPPAGRQQHPASGNSAAAPRGTASPWRRSPLGHQLA